MTEVTRLLEAAHRGEKQAAADLLWDLGSGREVLTLKAAGTTTGAAFFSPDGHAVWRGLDEDGRPWGWDATPLPEGKP